MANTTIRIKHSGSSGNVPSTLQPGELAINFGDGKLYYGNNTNHVIQLDTVTEPSGLDGEIQFNSLGSFGASSDLSFNVSTKTLNTHKIYAASDIDSDGTVFGNLLKSTQSSGDEGGQIDLAIPASNTTLSGDVAIDIWRNRLRIFETTGTNRGVYIDLSTASSGVGTNLLANEAVSYTVNNTSVLEATTITTSSVSQVTLDSWSSATYRSAKYFVQMTSGSEYNVIELSMVHDGANVYLTQYGEIKTTANSLGTFDASISTGTLSVLFTPTFSSTTVKASVTLIPV